MTGNSQIETISREEHAITAVTLPLETERLHPKVHNDTFFGKWNNAMAYILGYLVADGSVCKSGNRYRLAITTVDKNLIDHIVKELNSTYAISTELPKKDTHSVTYRTYISNDNLIMDLMSLGVIPNKTKNPVVPEIPKEHLSDFIRGLFDGDGCVTYGHYGNYADRLIIDIISYSKNFLELIGKDVKNEIGIIPKIYKHGNNFTLRYGCKEAVALYRFMYNEGFCLQRKKIKFEEFLSKKGESWLLRNCNLCGNKFTQIHDKSYLCTKCKIRNKIQSDLYGDI